MFSYCIVVLLIGSTIAVDPLVVTTKLGPVRGHHKKSFDGRTISAFEGIPFAKPPVGELRFEAPVDPDPWTETLDAQKLYECSQLEPMLMKAGGVEDCLYLNVYVPKEVVHPNDNLDVIVHIHGGAFMSGSPKSAGPIFFIDRDVIYVNFNYRLGPLGFLSTEDDVVPGNNGMKDQVLALKWVQNNIKLFGGNPNSVTLTGASSGGAAVHLHYFSKLSKGLFHRGVSESSTALGPWIIQDAALEKAKALGAVSDCEDTTTRLLIDCLKSRPVKDIFENIKKMSSNLEDVVTLQYTPVVEKSSSLAFMEDYPHQLLDSKSYNDLPWITSICTNEGSVGGVLMYHKLDKLDTDFDDNAHNLLDYNYTSCNSDKSAIAQAIRKYYFGSEKIGKEAIHKLMQLFGDRSFNLNFEESARIQSRVGKSKVYAYIYDYKNSFGKQLIQMMGITDIDFGVMHSDNAQLLYDISYGNIALNSDLSEDDKVMKNMLLDMYVTFASGDDPKFDDLLLKSVDSSHDKFTYLSINGLNNIKINITDELFPIKFWKTLPIVEYKKFDPESCNKKSFKTEL